MCTLNLTLFLACVLVCDPRGSHARLRHIQLQYALYLSSTPQKVSAKSAETPSWGTIRTPSRRADSRGHIREPQSSSLRNPLWKDLDSVPGHVQPRSTCSSYPTMSPPPPEFQNWATGRISNQAGAFSYRLPPKIKSNRAAADFNLILPMLIIHIRETFTFR